MGRWARIGDDVLSAAAVLGVAMTRGSECEVLDRPVEAGRSARAGRSWWRGGVLSAANRKHVAGAHRLSHQSRSARAEAAKHRPPIVPVAVTTRPAAAAAHPRSARQCETASETVVF